MAQRVGRRVLGAVGSAGLLVLGLSGVGLGSLVGVPAASAATPIPCPAPVVATGTATVTCSFTGADQTWTVPPLVTSETITAYGAQGGHGGGSPGGLGGVAAATFSVSSGTTFTVVAGGQGSSNGGETQVAGGFGGGGIGGRGGGGGGGGGSLVLRNTTELLIAGGGGGGSDTASPTSGQAGGNGGGVGGQAGTSGLAGGGGTQTQGGAAGAPAAGAAAGSPGIGGIGGQATHGGWIGGGGGGGGHFGGGGGGADFVGGAGGGGSGLEPSGVSFPGGTNAGNGRVVITYRVPTAPAITSADASTFAVGSPGTFEITTTGYPTGPTETISDGGATLPAGVTFVDNTNGTATLSGTPAVGTGGAYPFTITASNGVTPAATQSFTLTVDQAPAITSADASTFAVGSPGTFEITTTGYPTGPTETISDGGATLPAGVTFVDNTNGTATLSGTPAVGTGGAYPFTITASNGVTPAATQSFTLTVDQAPAITSADASTFAVGSPGTFEITTTGYPTGPTETISDGGATLPAGVTFVDNTNGTATLSGTPAVGTGGAYPFTITASNGVTPAATQSFTLHVTDGPAITVQPISQTLATGATATFVAAASGNPAPGVQWQRSTDGGRTFSAVTGATSSALSFIVGVGDDGDQYRAVFSNTSGSSTTAPATLTVNLDGYLLAQADGRVTGFGQAASASGIPTGSVPVVGIAATPDAQGYWTASGNGGVDETGDAVAEGSLVSLGLTPSAPVVGIAATPRGLGYWLVGADGGVFAFGNAPFEGSLPGSGTHSADVAGMTPTPDGEGYWLVGADGAVYPFGDAASYGSLLSLGRPPTAPIVGIAADPDGLGYWLIGADGGVFAFGSAPFAGSLPSSGVTPNAKVVGTVATRDGGGYWLVGADGGVFAFGSAPFEGSLPGSGMSVTDVVAAAP